MAIYKFTLEAASDKIFAHCVQIILRWGRILHVEYVDGPVAVQEELPIRKPHVQTKTARNEEIIAKYTTDPKTNSSCKLAEEYGVTRERICQILRRVNAIGNAQARLEAAREAIADAKAKLKADTQTALDAKVGEVLELVRQGKSIRQACMTVNLEPYSNFVNIIGKRVKLAGIEVQHGRHRDFSERKARVRALVAEGLSVPKIVERLRASTDPRIHKTWVYTNMPEAKLVRP